MIKSGVWGKGESKGKSFPITPHDSKGQTLILWGNNEANNLVLLAIMDDEQWSGKDVVG